MHYRRKLMFGIWTDESEMEGRTVDVIELKYRISDRTQLLMRPRRTKRDTTRDALGIIRAVQA